MMLAGMVDWAADAAASSDPLPPAPAPGRTDPLTTTVAAVGSAAKRAGGAGVQAIKDLPQSAAGAVRHPRRTTSDAVRMAASAVRMLRPHRGPLSPLMTGRGTTYTSMTLDVPFEAVRAAAKTHGGTLNDAFLAAVTGGLRRYHEHHGSEVGALRVNVPVSLRAEGQGATVNAVSIARVELDAGETDVAARFADASTAVRDARDEPMLPLADLAADASRLLPVGLIAEVARSSDVTASNVPGLPADVWVGGAALARLYPIVPTMGAAANITMLSYARRTPTSSCSASPTASPRSALPPRRRRSTPSRGHERQPVRVRRRRLLPLPAPLHGARPPADAGTSPRRGAVRAAHHGHRGRRPGRRGPVLGVDLQR
jgi:hypothetical protein